MLPHQGKPSGQKMAQFEMLAAAKARASSQLDIIERACRMETALMRADVVILAAAHSPGTLSPGWLRDNELIVDEITQFVHTADLSLYESETLSLIVDKERLQITAKRRDSDAVNRLIDFCERYVTLFPSLSYRAFGVNLSWRVTPGEGESLPLISVSVGSAGDLASILADHELSYGGIVYAKKDPYVLRLTIKPEEGASLSYVFNYHYNVSQVVTEQVLLRIGGASSLYDHSAEVVKKSSEAGDE
jgi:hypothetical protein